MDHKNNHNEIEYASTPSSTSGNSFKDNQQQNDLDQSSNCTCNLNEILKRKNSMADNLTITTPLSKRKKSKECKNEQHRYAMYSYKEEIDNSNSLSDGDDMIINNETTALSQPARLTFPDFHQHQNGNIITNGNHQHDSGRHLFAPDQQHARSISGSGTCNHTVNGQPNISSTSNCIPVNNSHSMQRCNEDEMSAVSSSDDNTSFSVPPGFEQQLGFERQPSHDHSLIRRVLHQYVPISYENGLSNDLEWKTASEVIYLVDETDHGRYVRFRSAQYTCPECFRWFQLDAAQCTGILSDTPKEHNTARYF